MAGGNFSPRRCLADPACLLGSTGDVFEQHRVFLVLEPTEVPGDLGLQALQSFLEWPVRAVSIHMPSLFSMCVMHTKHPTRMDEITQTTLETLVPAVPYADWNDFVDSLHAAQRRLNSAIRASVDEARALHESRCRHTAFRRTCEHSFPTFDEHSFPNLEAQTQHVLAILTRRQDSAFPRMLGRCIANSCRMTAATYADTISYYSCYNQHGEHILFDYDFLCELVAKSVYLTCKYHAVLRDCSLATALASKNFVVLDCAEPLVLSVREHRDFLLALCMGLHARLGSASSLLAMNSDILCKICASLLMPWARSMTVFEQRDLWTC